MTNRNLVFTLVWPVFLAATPAAAQENDSLSDPPPAPPVCPAPSRPDKARSRPAGFWENVQVTGGQLTLPFKIRPKAETQSFRLTTDVTVGAYVGLSKRISAHKNYFLTVPFAAGLTFISLHNSNTTLARDLDEAEVVPGITWCIGAILQLEQYSLGLMFGKDYASEVGNQWAHHGQMWWSFGIGFAFAQAEAGKSGEE